MSRADFMREISRELHRALTEAGQEWPNGYYLGMQHVMHFCREWRGGAPDLAVRLSREARRIEREPYSPARTDFSSGYLAAWQHGVLAIGEHLIEGCRIGVNGRVFSDWRSAKSA